MSLVSGIPDLPHVRCMRRSVNETRNEDASVDGLASSTKASDSRSRFKVAGRLAYEVAFVGHLLAHPLLLCCRSGTETPRTIQIDLISQSAAHAGLLNPLVEFFAPGFESAVLHL